MNNEKFECNGANQLVNRHTGEAIPLDEPVFILRARDRHALGAIRCYQALERPGSHNWKGLQRVIEDFTRFKDENDELMGLPEEVYA